MNCEAVTDRLIDLLDEELDETEAAEARAHLASCESCAAAFDRVSAGNELASFMKMDEPPASVRSAVLAAARDRAMERTSRPESKEQPARAAAREAEDEGGLWSSFVKW